MFSFSMNVRDYILLKKQFLCCTHALKKEKKKKDMPKAQYKELLAIGKFKFKKVSAHTSQDRKSVV